jgi:hypothetical protein
MDQFGIGNAIKSFAVNLGESARSSGRTTMMLQSLKNGDRIIFKDHKECERVKRLTRQHDLLVECVVHKAIFHPCEQFRRSPGRTVIDHAWVEDFYNSAIAKAEKEIFQIMYRLGDEHIWEQD